MKKIKVTKSLIKKLRPYWHEFELLHEEFLGKTYQLEQKMSKDLEINDLEFFQCDGDYCGIGNVNRTLPLILAEKLEEGE